jgi:hypothetical protein
VIADGPALFVAHMLGEYSAQLDFPRFGLAVRTFAFASDQFFTAHRRARSIAT